MNRKLSYLLIFTLGLIACDSKNKPNQFEVLSNLVVDDTDVLRYKIIKDFKIQIEKKDTIILYDELNVCRTDDGGDMFETKIDKHPYIDSLSNKIKACFLSMDTYDSLWNSIIKQKFDNKIPSSFRTAFINSKTFVIVTAFTYQLDTSIVVNVKIRTDEKQKLIQNKYFLSKEGGWQSK